MALATPRFCWQNLIQLGNTGATGSSVRSGNPFRWLRDQLRSKAWNSRTGWTIVAGFNDKIDFNRGGVKVATVAAGVYPTGALLATAVVAALEAADATPVWACSYAANKFTISSDLAFTLLFGTGANKDSGSHKELGFAMSDTGSSTSQVAPNSAYCSREYLHFDLKSALEVKAAIVISHNLTASGTIRVDGHSSPMNPVGATTIPGGAFSTTLAGTDMRIAFFSSATWRYWRMVLDDCGNPDGSMSVGLPYIGSYTEFPDGYAVGFPFRPEQLSSVVMADQGAHFFDQRQERRAWDLALPLLSDANRAALETIQSYVRTGRDFFVALDPTADAQKTYYVFLRDAVAFQHAPTASGERWNATVSIVEALG